MQIQSTVRNKKRFYNFKLWKAFGKTGSSQVTLGNEKYVVTLKKISYKIILLV